MISHCSHVQALEPISTLKDWLPLDCVMKAYTLFYLIFLLHCFLCILFQIKNYISLWKKSIILLDWTIKVSLLLFSWSASHCGASSICASDHCHWNHQGGKNISVPCISLYLFHVHLLWMQIFVNGMIKCCVLVCWDQGLFGNAVCAESQGWVTPEAREREGAADKRERGGGEIWMRTWRLISINASWMNISTSCTNYCIASACDQGHGEKPQRKRALLLIGWRMHGLLVHSLMLSFIMQTSLLLLLIVRGLNKQYYMHRLQQK